MAYLNSNTNNSQSRQMATPPSKPSVPSKPTFLKVTKSNGADDLSAQSNKATDDTPPKSLPRIPSLDHVTPKVWSNRQHAKIREKGSAVTEVHGSTSLNSPIEPRKSRFSAEWRPAPRPQNIKDQQEKSNRNNFELQTVEETASNKDVSTVSETNSVPSVELKESLQNCKIKSPKESSGDKSPLSEGRLQVDSNLTYRKSFVRDAGSSGFGSLRRMWDMKSSQSESFSPKPFTNSSVSSPKEKITAKPRSITVASPGSSISWHHVQSPNNQKITTSYEYRGDLQDAADAIDILSPKPFQSSSMTDKGHRLPGEYRHGNMFNFENTEIDQENHFANCPYNSHAIESVGSASFKQDEDKDDSFNVKDNTLSGQGYCSPEVGVYKGFSEDDNSQSDRVSADMGVYNESDVDRNQSYDVADCESSSEDELQDVPPVVPPHDPNYPSSGQTFAPHPRIPSLSEGYLPMAPHTNTTEEICYVDMSDDAEVEDANFHNQVVPPPPAGQTKKRRQYHEIDPDVPSPPYRDPPKLPPDLKSRTSRSPTPTQSEEERDTSRVPPPLPPDNVIGRRSLIHSKDKRLQIVQNLKDNFAKSPPSKEVKKLNYVEVEVTSERKPSHPISHHRRTNYSDVVVMSDSDHWRERSGSGTSEEGLSSGGKKQKNMKKKFQSLFAKDEPKTNQMKEVPEALADFEKERNKKKRISGRFLKKKNKDATKSSKKERTLDASDPEVGIYVDNDGGFAAASETSLSGSPPATTTGGDNPLVPSNVEAAKPPQGNPAPTYGDGGDLRRWKVLPTSKLPETGKVDRTTPPPLNPVLLPRSSKLPYKKSNSQGQIDSTFLAYPTDAAQKPQHSGPSEEAADPKPKHSFLHGTGETKREEVFRLQRPLSGPPLPPQNRPLSGPPLPDNPPHRPLSGSLSKPNDPSNGNLGAMPNVVPLPRLATALPRKEGFLPPVLPKPSSMKAQTPHSLPPDGSCYEEATDGALEGSNGLYLAADDSPPQLPDRDDTLYESIPASGLVPPSPFTKEDDTSKFLQSEPLYQIYRSRTMTHASAKRRAPSSVKEVEPSDQGEEWESELMSGELGTSTLWRSIPEVIKSGWVDKLSQEEMKLQQAQFEVLTSQASYLRSLNILVNHFMKDLAMESVDCLPTTDRHRLFSNIETVRNVEKRFLQDLENHFWKEIKLTRICELISQYTKEDFKVYVLYVQNQVYQDRVLTKLQRNHERFAEELCRLECSPGCNKLPLLSFLMLPMQRVTRLPLLVSAIVNAADAAGDSDMCQKAKQTLRVVNKLVKKCNEGARKMQQTEQLAEIASQLDYSSSVKMYALVSQSRSLVKKGEMTVSVATDSKKAAKTSKLWLFLFSDVLFIAKKKSYMEFGAPTRYEVIDWASRQYIAVNEQAVAENAIFLVILENQAGRRVEMSLMPLEQNELSRWEKALNPPTLGVTGESIYESWDCPQYTCIISYEALQPDELSLDVGDVMQVLKKTSDGWLEGERLRDGESGWFPLQNCEEIEDEHVRSRNMKNLYKMYAGSLDHA